MSTQRLPLLTKGSCPSAHTGAEGIRTFLFPGAFNKARFYNPSVSRLRETREPAPFTQGSRWVLTHQCVVSDGSGTGKPRPEKSGRGGNMRDTGNQPLTEPAVTPLMMNLLRQMYTTTTGRMASRMNMYTLPMSNLE